MKRVDIRPLLGPEEKQNGSIQDLDTAESTSVYRTSSSGLMRCDNGSKEVFTKEDMFDVGFPKHANSAIFDLGTCETLEPSTELLRSQKPLSCGSTCLKVVGGGCLALSVLALPYICSKMQIVPKGKIALCRNCDGSVRIVDSGCHLKETLFTSVSIHSLTDNEIHVGPMHIIRIKPGFIGLATRDGKPILMASGRHAVNDPLFRFDRAMSLNTPHIYIGTIHIITVPRNQNAVCEVNGVGHILEPGRHKINNPRFKFGGFVNSSNELISICAKHRILVPAGKVGLGWDRGKPVMLEAGKIYNIENQYFKYSGSKPVTEELITHGSLQVVTVKAGKLGISFDDGQLDILKPGRHFLAKPTHYFQGFLSSGQQTLPIAEVTSLSSDNVGLTFDAAITVQVVDGTKAVSVLAGGTDFTPKAFRENVVEKARLALSIIIGNNKVTHSFAATSSVKTATVHDALPKKGVQGSSFKQHIHDVFMHNFREDMLTQCGVDVIDMSIEDIKIVNTELAQAMARGAVKATELEMARTERMIKQTEAETQQLISRTQAETQQQAIIIKAEGEAKALDILAKAQAARIRELDAAMASVCETSRSRALVEVSGEALKHSKATVVLANDMLGLQRILGNGSLLDRNGGAS